MVAVSKRTFDIVSSAAALIVLAPFLLLIGLWIKLDSKGGVFFRQRRVGMHLEEFWVIKFRTMKARDPDQIDQTKEAMVSGGEDPRITRAGKFLRRTSLDELPQLWNILIGEMSVVGPRPIIPEQLAAIPSQYMERFRVRPGLTGLSQVRGRRDLDWILWLEADREYVRERGLILDIKVILLTVVVVLTGRGVYSKGEGRNWREFLPERRDREEAQSDVSGES